MKTQKNINVGRVRPDDCTDAGGRATHGAVAEAITRQEKITNTNSLPNGWEWSTLGDVSEKPQYGWTTKANHNDGRLKLLRTTDITSGSIDWSSVPFCTEEPEDVDKYRVESGDVLISRAGSVGVSFLINNPERAVFASYLIRFRPKSGIDTKYFYYYLKSPAYWEANRIASTRYAQGRAPHTGGSMCFCSAKARWISFGKRGWWI